MEAQSLPQNSAPHVSNLSKPLTRGELIGIAVAAGGIVLLFFVAAPTAAGVIDMHLTQLLLLIGWIVASTSAFVIEKLGARSYKRIVIVVGLTTVLSGTLALYTNAWIVAKKAELEVARSSTFLDPRAELLAGALKPIRDLKVSLKLDRTYSLQELGHFRIMAMITDSSNTSEMFLACQDAYLPNTNLDANLPQFGKRYTVRYREVDRTARGYGDFVAIPVYTRQPRYTTVIGSSQSADALEISLDLYNQIPLLKTLEDLNRKSLNVYVTENLEKKISEFSFTVNNFELISKKADALIFTNDKPSVAWFMPLSPAERSVEWCQMFLKPTSELREIAKSLPNSSNLVVVWMLDFTLLDVKKVPEPEAGSSPYLSL